MYVLVNDGVDTYHTHTHTHSIRDNPPLAEAKRQQFSGALAELVLVLVGLMRLPHEGVGGADCSWEGMEKDEKEDVVDYRYRLVSG